VDQGVRRLDDHPTVDIVCALRLDHDKGTLTVRVEGGERVITPSEFRRLEPAPDRIAIVRRTVVDLWLSIPGDYFALEGLYWITAELKHSSLALDEPWVHVHTHSENSLTAGFKTGQGQALRLRDYATWLGERQELIECGPCIPVDRLLEGIYFDLVRAKHPTATTAAAALRSRGVSPRGVIARRLSMRVRRMLGHTPAVHRV
jgi:hypothetical protein